MPIFLELMALYYLSIHDNFVFEEWKDWLDEVVGIKFVPSEQIKWHFRRMITDQKLIALGDVKDDSTKYCMGLKGPAELEKLLSPDYGIYVKLEAVYRGLNELVDALQCE